MKSKITIGFSPCPNDTFIFDALVNKRIDTGEINFIPYIADVEELNKLALAGKLDITKLSFNAYAFASSAYQILNAGSALGNNCGPLLISSKDYSFSEIEKLKIAIPGKFTTANLLLTIFAPQAINKTEVLFSEIENQVLNGVFDAGLIIHENRFTYAQRGLKKIADMGELWEQQFNTPIPLGCIAVKRSFPDEVKWQVNNMVSKSIEYAFSSPLESKPFVKQHAQEMDDEIIKNHIKLYVNNFSVNLENQGKKAIELLLHNGFEKQLLPEVKNIFLDSE